MCPVKTSRSANCVGLSSGSAVSVYGIERGNVLGEVVRVEVDGCGEKHTQLRSGERHGCVSKDALEGILPCLALFGATGLLGFVLPLLAFPLGLALLFLALLFGLVLSHAHLMLGLPCCGLFRGFRLGRGCLGGRWVVGALCRDVRVVDRTIGVRANGHGSPDVTAKHDDGGFGVWAGRLGVRVVGRVEFAVLMLLQGTGALLLGRSPRRFQLHKLRTCGKLAVDVRRDHGLVAGRVKALVTLHVMKQAGVEPAAARAGDASSGSGV